MKVALIISILISKSYAFTQAFNKCPDKFIATVINVEDLDFQGLAKVEVRFKIVQNLKGNSFDTKVIQIVKDGPFKFDIGQSYTVETRENWLCHSEVLSSI